MRTFRCARPSSARLISIIALIVAMGGTAYAGLSVPRNSVGAKQLKKSAVTNKKISNGAVTDSKIAKGTITGDKIKLSTLGTVPSANTARPPPQPTTDHCDNDHCRQRDHRGTRPPSAESRSAGCSSTRQARSCPSQVASHR